MSAPRANTSRPATGSASSSDAALLKRSYSTSRRISASRGSSPSSSSLVACSSLGADGSSSRLLSHASVAAITR